MRFKKISVLFNPIAGQGKGEKLALHYRSILNALGYVVTVSESLPFYSPAQASSLLEMQDLLIVSGGDGTLRPLLPFLAQTKIPVYMAPSGNESLFAKLFKMNGDMKSLLQTLNNGVIEHHYFANANGSPFFHMTSIGFDAEVVKSISCDRSGPIRHRGYLKPMLKALLSHRAPRLTITVDGDKKIVETTGYCIIANSPAYALRIPLAKGANSAERALRGYFYPMKKGWNFFLLAVVALLFKSTRLWKSIPLNGSTITITSESDSQSPVQADGDFIGTTPVNIQKSEACVSVLVSKQKNSY